MVGRDTSIQKNCNNILAPTMEQVRTFLESSTIHGLAHILTTRRIVRLFWVIVVLSGFIGAGIIIYQSFQSWEESPIKTTLKTRPIREMKFPKLTVCPPKNTFTDLNYDLMMTENMTLDNDTRNELVNYAVELLFKNLHYTNMKNLDMLKDHDRYYNWYHGYTQITLPYFDLNYATPRLKYTIGTSASAGNISTINFGENFDVDKVAKKLMYSIKVFSPKVGLIKGKKY